MHVACIQIVASRRFVVQVTNKLDADLFNYIPLRNKWIQHGTFYIYASLFASYTYYLHISIVMPVLPLLLASLLPGHD